MNDLQTLVKTHQARAAQRAAEPVDWEQRKRKWLAVLDLLLQDIETNLVTAGVPPTQIRSKTYPIREEKLGHYEARGLEVEIGIDTVKFEPIASVIIGGYGRVDVAGPHGEVKLIAQDSDPFRDLADRTPAHEREWIWSAYADGARREGFRLDSAGLAKVLAIVLGDA